jgi:hypothetical protein
MWRIRLSLLTSLSSPLLDPSNPFRNLYMHPHHLPQPDMMKSLPLFVGEASKKWEIKSGVL